MMEQRIAQRFVIKEFWERPESGNGPGLDQAFKKDRALFFEGGTNIEHSSAKALISG